MAFLETILKSELIHRICMGLASILTFVISFTCISPLGWGSFLLWGNLVTAVYAALSAVFNPHIMRTKPKWLFALELLGLSHLLITFCASIAGTRGVPIGYVAGWAVCGALALVVMFTELLYTMKAHSMFISDSEWIYGSVTTVLLIIDRFTPGQHAATNKALAFYSFPIAILGPKILSWVAGKMGKAAQKMYPASFPTAARGGDNVI